MFVYVYFEISQKFLEILLNWWHSGGYKHTNNDIMKYNLTADANI